MVDDKRPKAPTNVSIVGGHAYQGKNYQINLKENVGIGEKSKLTSTTPSGSSKTVYGGQSETEKELEKENINPQNARDRYAGLSPNAQSALIAQGYNTSEGQRTKSFAEKYEGEKGIKDLRKEAEWQLKHEGITYEKVMASENPQEVFGSFSSFAQDVILGQAKESGNVFGSTKSTENYDVDFATQYEAGKGLTLEGNRIDKSNMFYGTEEQYGKYVGRVNEYNALIGNYNKGLESNVDEGGLFAAKYTKSTVKELPKSSVSPQFISDDVFRGSEEQYQKFIGKTKSQLESAKEQNKNALLSQKQYNESFLKIGGAYIPASLISPATAEIAYRQDKKAILAQGRKGREELSKMLSSEEYKGSEIDIMVNGKVIKTVPQENAYLSIIKATYQQKGNVTFQAFKTKSDREFANKLLGEAEKYNSNAIYVQSPYQKVGEKLGQPTIKEAIPKNKNAILESVTKYQRSGELVVFGAIPSTTTTHNVYKEPSGPLEKAFRGGEEVVFEYGKMFTSYVPVIIPPSISGKKEFGILVSKERTSYADIALFKSGYALPKPIKEEYARQYELPSQKIIGGKPVNLKNPEEFGAVIGESTILLAGFPRSVVPIRFNSRIAFEGIGKIPTSKAFPNVMTEGSKVIELKGTTLGYEGKYAVGVGMKSSEGEKYLLSRLRPKDIAPTLAKYKPYSERGMEYAFLTKLTQAKLLTPQGAETLSALGKVNKEEFIDLVVGAKSFSKASEKLQDVKLSKPESQTTFSELELTGSKNVNQQIRGVLTTVQSQSGSAKASGLALIKGDKQLAGLYSEFPRTPFPSAKGSYIQTTEISKFNQEQIIGGRTKNIVPVKKISEIGDIDFDLAKESQSEALLGILQKEVKTPKGYEFGRSGLNITYGKKGQEGIKILNLLGKADELNTELSAFGSGTIYGRNLPKGEISQGGFKTKKIEFQSKSLLKSITSGATKETLASFEEGATPDIVKGTLARFKGKETIVSPPYIRLKDVGALYSIGKYGEKTIKGKEGKILGEYSQNLQKYFPYFDWKGLESKTKDFQYVSSGKKYRQSTKAFLLIQSAKTMPTSSLIFQNKKSQTPPSISLISSKSNLSFKSLYSPKSLSSSISPKSPRSLPSSKSPSSVKSLYSPKSLSSLTSTKSPTSIKSTRSLFSLKSSLSSISTRSPKSPRSLPSSKSPLNTLSPKSPRSPLSLPSPRSPPYNPPYSPPTYPPTAPLLLIGGNIGERKGYRQPDKYTRIFKFNVKNPFSSSLNIIEPGSKRGKTLI